VRSLYERYDGIKMLEFHLLSLKPRSIALLLTSVLRNIDEVIAEVTLFLISPYFRSMVSG